MATCIYDKLPWAHIRFRWEHSWISLAGLARVYGIRSTTTLARRRDAEQWSRARLGQRRTSKAAPKSEQTDHSPPQTLEYARELQMAGSTLLEHINVVLRTPGDDPHEVAWIEAHEDRLRLLNPGRKTRLQLIEVAGQIFNVGIVLEQALLNKAKDASD